MTRFAALVLDWYAGNARRLPWRYSRDPYAVWVSESMLQQTRVETVVPYYTRWISRFPSIAHLARAHRRTVLLHWEGLGYYARARNMHRAAQIVMDRFDGALPSEIDALRSLPGIGEYTAAAIASIAFKRDVAAIDGNVRRVFARFFNVREVLSSGEAETRFRRLADANLPKGRAGDFNQGLMDLGARICLPRNPRCDACPLSGGCRARRLSDQAVLPARPRPRRVPHKVIAAAVVRRGKHVLLTRRPARGLLGGLWMFPQIEMGRAPQTPTSVRARFAAALATSARLRIDRPSSLVKVKHAYSHFRVTMHAFRCRLRGRGVPSSFKWIAMRQLPEHPMGKVDRLISQSVWDPSRASMRKRRPRPPRSSRVDA